jgi:hypothetical protein
MADQLWVARLRISRATAHKIATRHGLQAAEVREAVERVRGLRFSWDDDRERGRRAIVETFIRGHRVAVVLYPVNEPIEDEYNLGSAYHIP